jgi:hypothetical protein
MKYPFYFVEGGDAFFVVDTCVAGIAAKHHCLIFWRCSLAEGSGWDE